MRGTDNGLVVLHPDISDLSRVGHIGLPQNHILLVEQEDLTGLCAYGDRTSVDTHG